MKAQSPNSLRIKFTPEEVGFLLRNEGCRVATVTPKNTPHITPVSYIFEKGRLYFATDYHTRKYKNLRENPKIAIVVDVYSSVNNTAVIIHGKVSFIEYGEKFKKLYNIFYRKFEWVRNEPWKEREAAFVEIEPYKKISWGLE